MDVKKELENILHNALSFQQVEAVFAGLLIYDENDEEERKKAFIEKFLQFLSTVQQPANQKIVYHIIEFANRQSAANRLQYIYELLKLLVDKEIINARSVCEAILDSDYLKFNKYPTVWKSSFQMIAHLLPNMDYKTVRVVFSILLTFIKSELPDKIMESQINLMDDLKKVVQMGLDRDICLLPSYFVSYEITKLYPDDSFRPHWVFGKLFTDFINSFRPLAQMVVLSGHSLLFPVIGHCGSSNVWNINPDTLKFPLKGTLPYQKPYNEPQKRLLKNIIIQPYSADFVCSMLGFKKQHKQRCKALEELLVNLIVNAMEKYEQNHADESLQLLWPHLSSQFIFYILFQLASFPHMIEILHTALSEKHLLKGRNQLMWILLQFISGRISGRPISGFAPIFKLFELLYPEKEPIPVPAKITGENFNEFAMACIWIHLSNKMESENAVIMASPPTAISKQLEFLNQSLQRKTYSSNPFENALVCNAYSTSQEVFPAPLQELMVKCYGNQQMASGGGMAVNSVPLEMKLLDSLTVHTKMSLIYSIVSRITMITKANKQQPVLVLAPALVETYSRLLVYMEIEVFGMRVFITQLLPMSLKYKAWGILHMLLEMLSYRLHRIQLQNRVSLLTHLHSVALLTAESIQLPLCVHQTALHLIMGFGNTDIQLQLSMQRIANEPEKMLSKDCEELNRVLIITIARAMQVTIPHKQSKTQQNYTKTDAEGLPFTWCENVLREAMNLNTGGKVQSWSAATMSFFPKAIQRFYATNQVKEDTTGKVLIEKVELHYRKIKAFGGDEESIFNYCTEAEPSVAEIFLCILWRMVVENGRLSPVCYRILMKLRSKTLANFLNVFSDFIVHEFKMFISGSQQVPQQLSKRFQHLTEFIWKYHIVQLDRLILSLCLRPLDEKNSQISFYIIKILLLQRNEFKTRVRTFVSENSPQHWKQVDGHERHMKFLEKYPERFYFEGIIESANNAQSQEYLPCYFGNICLRFVPVLDILTHRLLELPSQHGNNLLDMLFTEYGLLFKFHERPITYLYNTLFYFNNKLNEEKKLKRKLVTTLISSQKENHPDGWAFSQEVLHYYSDVNSDASIFNLQYFFNLINRLINVMRNRESPHFVSRDWRFNEFPNPSAHGLYTVCVELMSLPLAGNEIGIALVDVITRCGSQLNTSNRAESIMEYINAVSLVFASLPDSYLNVLNKKIVAIILNQFASVQLTTGCGLPTFFDIINHFSMKCENYPDYIMCLFHATWIHTSMGRFSELPGFLRNELKPIITNELQYLYVLCLYGPFLQRLQQERNEQRDGIFEVSVEFYYILERVCRNTTQLVFNDVITDFLYHLKYMYVGDNLRDTILKVLPNLHLSLQNLLKFMATPPTMKNENLPQLQQQQQQPQQQEQLLQPVETQMQGQLQRNQKIPVDVINLVNS